MSESRKPLLSVTFDDDDVIVEARGAKYSGTVRLQNAANNPIKVKVGSGKVQTINAVYNDIDDTVVSGSRYGDYIFNAGYGASLNAGNDNDYIVNSRSGGVSINAGNGNDFIISSRYCSYYNPAPITIDGGAGNDTVSVSNERSYFGRFYEQELRNIYRFDADSGNDLIIGHSNSDTIQLVDTSVSTYRTDGSDMILEFDGGNHITLKRAAYNSITLRDADGHLDYRLRHAHQRYQQGGFHQ